MWIPRPIYSGLFYAVSPLVTLYLLKRSRKQPDYKKHWDERYGLAQYPAPRPQRKRIWIHAVSVGETRAALPLIKAILKRWPQTDILLTSMTPTGRDVAKSFMAEYGPRIDVCYLPYDLPAAMRKFIRQVRPELCLLMETEVWPNLTYQTAKAGVPTVLVNGRLSEKSLRQTLRLRSLLGPAMERLTLCLAQSEEDAERFSRAGCKKIAVTGNLKFDFTPNFAQIETARALKKGAARPVVLLASSRDGEEEAFLDALKDFDWKLKAKPLLLIVPRHPQRFKQVEALLRDRGLKVALRSETRNWREVLQENSADTLLGDSMGEMSFYYSLADVTIMGGSFGPYGSQSMIEPCAIGMPVIVGPSIFNFKDAVEEGEKAGAVLRARDFAEALAESGRLLSDRALCQEQTQNALLYAEKKRGATERTIGWLDQVLADGRKE
jgi:3-deoxy-D-manno-octulosonic-acid transferase